MATDAEIKAAQVVIGAKPDGAFGGRSVDALVGWLRSHGHLAPAVAPNAAREGVVYEAQAHVGQWTEAEVDALWREVGVPQFVGNWHSLSWCGGYALRCLRRALGVDWTWKPSYGFLEVHALPKVSLPEIGDVAYFAKNQHHAIVSAIPGAGKVTLVNGNGLTAPLEGVTETTRPIGDATVYYSIRNLVAS